MGTRRPRIVWHAAAGAVVAAYLLAAAVVVAAHRVMPVPQWLALHLLVLGAATRLVAALAADTAGLAGGLSPAGQVLGRLLIPVLGVGVVGQTLTGALTFLLPVTAGGGPAGNRRLTAILERGWRTRAILGNAGVLALAALPGGGWPRIVAWAAVLAGFGTFPVLAASALAAARAGTSRPGQGRRARLPRHPLPAARGPASRELDR
jgi:nitrite reductase (NO-forming)